MIYEKSQISSQKRSQLFICNPAIEGRGVIFSGVFSMKKALAFAVLVRVVLTYFWGMLEVPVLTFHVLQVFLFDTFVGFVCVFMSVGGLILNQFLRWPTGFLIFVRVVQVGSLETISLTMRFIWKRWIFVEIRLGSVWMILMRWTIWVRLLHHRPWEIDFLNRLLVLAMRLLYFLLDLGSSWINWFFFFFMTVSLLESIFNTLDTLKSDLLVTLNLSLKLIGFVIEELIVMVPVRKYFVNIFLIFLKFHQAFLKLIYIEHIFF